MKSVTTKPAKKDKGKCKTYENVNGSVNGFIVTKANDSFSNKGIESKNEDEVGNLEVDGGKWMHSLISKLDDTLKAGLSSFNINPIANDQRASISSITRPRCTTTSAGFCHESDWPPL